MENWAGDRLRRASPTRFTRWISVDILCARYCRRCHCWGQYTEAGWLLWATCLQRSGGCISWSPWTLGPCENACLAFSLSHHSWATNALSFSWGPLLIPSLGRGRVVWYPSHWIPIATHAHPSVHFRSASLRFLLCRRCSPKADNSAESLELRFRNRLACLAKLSFLCNKGWSHYSFFFTVLDFKSSASYLALLFKPGSNIFWPLLKHKTCIL